MAQSASQAGFMKDGASRRIFLIRHGVTDWNRQLRYQGSSDVDLNAEGMEQARLLGIRLSSVVPTRIISSPLKRAYCTAEAIMERSASSADIEISDDIREVSFGFWEGLTVTEVEELDGDTVRKWRKAPFAEPPRGGEPLSDILDRASNALDGINSSVSPGDVTFVVAHGAILRALLAKLLGIDDMNLLWRMRFDNCSVTLAEMWGRRPSLLLLNDTQHLRMDEERIISNLKFPV